MAAGARPGIPQETAPTPLHRARVRQRTLVAPPDGARSRGTSRARGRAAMHGGRQGVRLSAGRTAVDGPSRYHVFVMQELINLESRKMAAKTAVLGGKKKTADRSISLGGVLHGRLSAERRASRTEPCRVSCFTTVT